MPTAAQWERIADQVCRSLGGRHGAAEVVCPVGVRLLREVAASRFEGRPGSAARVLDSARLTIRTLARVPFKKGREPSPPEDDFEESPGPKLPIPAIPHRPRKALGTSRRRGMKGGAIRGVGTTVADLVAPRSIEKLKRLVGSARHAVSGGFIPGESGF